MLDIGHFYPYIYNTLKTNLSVISMLLDRASITLILYLKALKMPANFCMLSWIYGTHTHFYFFLSFILFFLIISFLPFYLTSSLIKKSSPLTLSIFNLVPSLPNIYSFSFSFSFSLNISVLSPFNSSFSLFFSTILKNLE